MYAYTAVELTAWLHACCVAPIFPYSFLHLFFVEKLEQRATAATATIVAVTKTTKP